MTTSTTKDQHGQVSLSSSSRDLFLSGDERFQVWEVKAAERPHLLLTVCDDDDDENEHEHVNNNNNDEPNNKPIHHTHQHENKDENDDSECSTTAAALLPVTDGCDIPGWRRAKIGYSCTNHVMEQSILFGALSIGPGCTLMRRETQLPMLSTKRAHCDWKALQSKLLNAPTPAPTPPHEEGTPTADAANMLTMIPRISYKDHNNNTLSVHAWFERENVPVLLEGCMSDWKAMETYRWDALMQEFGDCEWRFSDTHGETMSLHVYNKYCNSLDGGLTDDSPLGIYDSQFHLDNDSRKRLLHDYHVPSCFNTDLFALLDNPESDNDNDSNSDQEDSRGIEEGDEEENENADTDAVAVERPPYRWILMGPERSGTGLHVDPVGTHAWVSLIQGCKRWVLFPPDTCRKTIGMMEEHQIPSVLWFRDYYDKVCCCLPTSAATSTTSSCGQESHQNGSVAPGAVHVIQRPGETVYVPAGWPHLVLNLEASVAITENYATEYPSMNRLWKAVEEAEPALAVRFREALEKHRPDLAAQITCINTDEKHVTNTTADGNDNKSSCVSVISPTSSHEILKTCGKEEASMSQSENEQYCHGCRIVD